MHAYVELLIDMADCLISDYAKANILYSIALVSSTATARLLLNSAIARLENIRIFMKRVRKGQKNS